jgi:hypothetical protein
MENNVLVSIIIPCYNQAQFLDAALQSVHYQTYSNWECIVVNDGSADNSEDIAKEWTAKDIRFQYFHKENAGVSSARNLGIEKAKGQYLQFVDADDIVDKRKLELSLQELNLIENKGLKIVISNFRMFVNNVNDSMMPYCNLEKQLFNYEGLLYKWSENFTIPIHCGFFDATLFETIRFPENMTAQEDWVVWVTLFRTGCKALFIDKPLAFYRLNPSSRMMTKGIDDNQIKAYEWFKIMLSVEEFNEFSLHLISKYYKLNQEFKFKLSTTKNSNSYQTGLMVKKVLKKSGVLKLAKSMLPILLKFKK